MEMGIYYTLEIMQIKFLLTGPYCLDNFSPHSVIYNRQKYPTAEHLYQALKFSDPKIIAEIIDTNSPMQSKIIASKYKQQRLTSWPEIKVETMKQILNLKFEQHPEIQNYLKSTKDAELIENNPEDDFWGVGDGSGQNMIGKLFCFALGY